MTIILGVTGGIATGKSTVSRYLGQLGYPVIDSDQIARLVVEPGSPGLEKLVAHFGPEIRLADGTLNRKALGNLVFEDAEKRQELDQLLDEDIRSEHHRQVADAVKTETPLVVLDIPLLFEAHYEELVDVAMVVAVPPEEQLRRLCQRNQLTEAEGRARLASQLPIAEKEKLADVVIDNSGSLAATYQQVDQWLCDVGLKTT